jgi:MbnP
MAIKIIPRLILFLCGIWTLTACQKEIGSSTGETGPVELRFQNFVGSQPLTLGGSYTNAFAENFTVNKFKYYITNIELLNTGSGKKKPVPDSYFLVDQANPASLNIDIDAATGSYNAISFLIGVDSIRNVSGAQTGALDPLMDMFWTWNSGYIMAKMEGTSPVSSLPDQMIEYHIGGFKGENNVVRQVILAFPSSLEREVLKNSKLIVDVQADLNTWFQNPNSLSITDYPTCTSPGELAKKYSENYSKMFSIYSIESQ